MSLQTKERLRRNRRVFFWWYQLNLSGFVFTFLIFLKICISACASHFLFFHKFCNDVSRRNTYVRIEERDKLKFYFMLLETITLIRYFATYIKFNTNKISADVLKQKNSWIMSIVNRESNKRRHSKPGAVPYVPERKKAIVKEVE